MGKPKKTGRANGSAKPAAKPKPTTGKKGGRRPDGGLGLRDDERQAQHEKFLARYEASEQRKKDAAKDFADLKKEIEGQGVTITSIKLAIRARDDEDGFKAMLGEMAEQARWGGVGVQLSMFKDDSDPIFEDGKRSAMRNQPAKPPAHLAQKAAQRWLKGHEVGRAAQNKLVDQAVNGGGPKTLAEAASPAVAELARQAGVANTDIGSEPPTHRDAETGDESRKAA